MNDFKIIKNDLIALGLCKGDSVLIHSSFKSVGNVDGGIQTLVDAILDCIGSGGTLLAPSLSYEHVPMDNPIYNHAQTPSCVGAVSEYIRKMPGAKRSIHPTHSCAAIGDKKDKHFACLFVPEKERFAACCNIGSNFAKSVLLVFTVLLPLLFAPFICHRQRSQTSLSCRFPALRVQIFSKTKKTSTSPVFFCSGEGEI